MLSKKLPVKRRATQAELEEEEAQDFQEYQKLIRFLKDNSEDEVMSSTDDSSSVGLDSSDTLDPNLLFNKSKKRSFAPPRHTMESSDDSTMETSSKKLKSNQRVEDSISISRSSDTKFQFDEQDDDSFSIAIPPEFSERDSEDNENVILHTNLETSESSEIYSDTKQPENHGPLHLSKPIHSYFSSNFLGRSKEPRPEPSRLKVLSSFPSPPSLPPLSSHLDFPPLPSNPNANRPVSNFKKAISIQMTERDGRKYKCPFCETNNLNESKLVKHVSQDHPKKDGFMQAVCPICALGPSGDPNYVSPDIHGHFSLRHSERVAPPFGAFAPPLPRLGIPNRDRLSLDPLELASNSRVPFTSGFGLRLGRHGNVNDALWEYVLQIDSSQVKKVIELSCDSCRKPFQLHDIQALLACQHIFHTDCVSNDADPSCPICQPTTPKPHKHTKKYKKNLNWTL